MKKENKICTTQGIVFKKAFLMYILILCNIFDNILKINRLKVTHKEDHMQ